jgi:glucosyl-3-phosphoglycerate synthase
VSIGGESVGGVSISGVSIGGVSVGPLTMAPPHRFGHWHLASYGLVAAASSGPIPRPLWMWCLPWWPNPPPYVKDERVRTFDQASFDVGALVGAKRGRTVTVCLPACNEAATVGTVVDAIVGPLVRSLPLVDEVLVVDDGSTDATAAEAAAAGARVVAAGAVLPELGPASGKGEAMWKGLAAAEGDLVAYCDADVRNFTPGFVVGLLGPLLTTEDVAFVKGFYRRPGQEGDERGGRVTELVARPLIAVLFPALAPVAQPLAGECAGRREVLEQVPFVEGYGVDLGLLLDVAARFGVDAIAQVDLGTRVHRNRPLEELAPQADAVLRAGLSRAGLMPSGNGRAGGPAVAPPRSGIGQRPPLNTLPARRS